MAIASVASHGTSATTCATDTWFGGLELREGRFPNTNFDNLQPAAYQTDPEGGSGPARTAKVAAALCAARETPPFQFTHRDRSLRRFALRVRMLYLRGRRR